MTTPLIPDVGPRLEAELQQILVDVRGLVAERDALARRHTLGGHAMNANGVCDPYCDRCAGIRSKARAEGLREAAKRCHTNAHMDGNLSVTAFELEAMAGQYEAQPATVKDPVTVQPCRCDCDDNGTWRGRCTCAKSADQSKRLGWLEAANFLETAGQFAEARALRREAGVSDGE